MTLNRDEMMRYALDWVAKRNIAVSPGSQHNLEAVLDRAAFNINNRIGQVRALTERSNFGPISLQVEGSLEVLLETMRKLSPDGNFHENSADEALMRLGPGWWPFT